MQESLTIPKITRIGVGVSFIAFPVMFLVGFLMHPNFWSRAESTNMFTKAGLNSGALDKILLEL